MPVRAADALALSTPLSALLADVPFVAVVGVTTTVADTLGWEPFLFFLATCPSVGPLAAADDGVLDPLVSGALVGDLVRFRLRTSVDPDGVLSDGTATAETGSTGDETGFGADCCFSSTSVLLAADASALRNRFRPVDTAGSTWFAVTSTAAARALEPLFAGAIAGADDDNDVTADELPVVTGASSAPARRRLAVR